MIYILSSPRFLSFLRCVDACAATSTAGYIWRVLLEICPDIQRELEAHKSTILAKLRAPKRRCRYLSQSSDDVPKLIIELRKKKELDNFVYRDRTFPDNIRLQEYKTREQDKVSRKFRHTKSNKMFSDAKHRPDWVLKRICYRIRWMEAFASRAFDLDKFYSTLTARIMLGLLEMKVSCRTECLAKHIDQKLCTADRRNLKQAIRRLAEHSESMSGYINYLLLKASKDPQAQMSTRRNQLHADSSTPGFHRTTTKESKHMQSMMEQSMPRGLSDRIIDKRVCWYCNSCQANTSVCSGCKIARYCKKECQKDAWVEHKQVCAQYCRMFNNPLFKKRLQDAHPQTKWIELIV